MAIKGKSRAKSKPRQVARAPRREPVVVKPPLLQRRWLQLTATFILGVFAMSIAVWVWHGVHRDNAQKAAANAASTKRAAAQGWQTAVEGSFATIGTTPHPGTPPAMFPDMAAALTAMEKSQVPPGAAATFSKAAKGAANASAAITKYGVADKIRNQGFDPQDATAFTDSLSGLVTALDQYAKAAEAAGLALKATGAQQHALVTFAQGLQDSAASTLSNAWADYEDALAAGGITESPLPSGATGTTPIGG